MKTTEVISALRLNPHAKVSSALIRAKDGVISHRTSSSGPWWVLAVVVGDVVLHCRAKKSNHSTELIEALAHSRTIVSTIRKNGVPWHSNEGFIQVPPRTVNLRARRTEYAKAILGRLFDKTGDLSDGTPVNLSDLAWEVALTTFAKKNSPSEFTEEQLHAKIEALPRMREFRQVLHQVNNFKGTPHELIQCLERLRSTSSNAVWRGQEQITVVSNSKAGGKSVSLPWHVSVHARVVNGDHDVVRFGTRDDFECIWTKREDTLPLAMWRVVADVIKMYGFTEPKPFGLAVTMDNIPALASHNQTSLDTLNTPLAALGKSSAPSIANALI